MTKKDIEGVAGLLSALLEGVSARLDNALSPLR